MQLSIVIPAFEESTKIAKDIMSAAEFLDGNGYNGEIIVVDDCSEDDTAQVAKATTVPGGISLKVLRYEPHKGKGAAVRTGILETSGEYVMFADSGVCVPFGNALQGLQMIQSGQCDIAHGSRKMIDSDIQQSQPLYRRMCSRLFKWTINKALKIPATLTDTQCGFKVYKGDVAREVYAECTTDGFMFDVEVILIARKRGYKIAEFPVEWTCDLDSRLSLTRTPWPVITELRTIRRNMTKEVKPGKTTADKTQIQSID